MKNNDSGPVIAIIAVIAVIIIGAGIASAASNNTKTKSTTNYTSAPSSTSYTPSYDWGFDEDEEGEEEVWTCRDATSYDRNSSNDNHCTSNKGGDRYVDDCTAVKLDPTYHPSQRGASYYNGCAW